MSCVGRGLVRGQVFFRGVLLKCLKGFIVLGVNSELEQAREHNLWNVQALCLISKRYSYLFRSLFDESLRDT
jgi:hypothetical protein